MVTSFSAPEGLTTGTHDGACPLALRTGAQAAARPHYLARERAAAGRAVSETVEMTHRPTYTCFLQLQRPQKHSSIAVRAREHQRRPGAERRERGPVPKSREPWV
jgi:hypothetical protein